MAQSDQVVQNDTFPAFRADLNNNLAALFSNNSGPVAPTPTVAFMDWIDTSSVAPVWQKRNAANNAWIAVGTINGGVIELTNVLPSQVGQSGKYLTTNGTIASWGAVATAANAQVFTSSGTFTPTAGKTSFLTFTTGGGGGGSGSVNGSTSGTGGGGGTGFRFYNNAEMGGSASVTVGAGGAGGTPGGTATFTPGQNGGSSSVDPSGSGLTLTSTGGTGGSYLTNGTPGSSTNSQFGANGNARFSFWYGVIGTGGTVPTNSNGNPGQPGIVVILEF
jgi:hypothetical protein